MRIISWNVNGIRAAAKKGFGNWLDRCEAQVVALQEVRAREDQIPEDLKEKDGWFFQVQAAERAGYSGVGLLSRTPADSIESSLGEERFDVEGRLQFATFGELLIVNGYFPNGNGKNRDLSRIPYKLDFYRRLFERLESERTAGRPILVMGDLNTAHEDIDLARPAQNRKTSGFRPEEREELDRWLQNGWADTFRHVEPGDGHYSWWSQRKGVREKNIGWRIDYVLASPGAMPFIKNASIHPDVMGSDHCPISVDVDPAILGS